MSVVVEEMLQRLSADLRAELGSAWFEIKSEPAWSYPAAPPGWEPPDEEICLRLDQGLDAIRYGVRSSEAVEPQLIDIADRMQDDIATMLVVAWPACPRHGHPATPALIDGKATWICPNGEGAIATVGELHR